MLHPIHRFQRTSHTSRKIVENLCDYENIRLMKKIFDETSQLFDKLSKS